MVITLNEATVMRRLGHESTEHQAKRTAEAPVKVVTRAQVHTNRDDESMNTQKSRYKTPPTTISS